MHFLSDSKTASQSILREVDQEAVLKSGEKGAKSECLHNWDRFIMSKLFSLIQDGEVHPASNQKVIPLEDFSTLMEASELLEKARQDAESHLAATEAECIELRETAKKEGYQEGLEQLNANIIGLDQEKSGSAMR